MAELVKVLYEDPSVRVSVDDKEVYFTDLHPEYSGALSLSHAQMREIDLAWTRHELKEKE